MYIREALELRIKLLGEHQDTARSHVDLSDIFIVKKDFKSAMEQLEEAIEIQEKVLGDEHETTKKTLTQLRRIQSMCEGEKGRVLIQEGIELRKELGVPVNVAACYRDLENKLKKKTIKDDEDITKDKRNNNEDLIPASVRARGEKALAAYHRALETGGSTYDKRVKVLLVGQDRVGKTSLGKALRGEPFDEAELSTEGVQMIPAIKNAGTGAWRNPASLEHTTVFDHKAKHFNTNFVHSTLLFFYNHTENPISSKADEGKTQLPQQKEASREVKENQAQKNQIPILSKADEGKFQLRQQEEVSSEVKENQAQKSQDQDLENQAKTSGLPDEIAVIVEQHLEKNEADTDEKIWPIIWDFAGQDIYRAIHPIFMSSDDIYLLAFDLTKKLSEKAECRVNIGHKELTATARDSEDTNLDHLFRWMDLIHSLKNFQRDGLSYPPVILVGTHADRVDDPRKAIESVVDKKCLKVFDEYTYLLHIADYRPIDNTKSGKSTDQEEIIELRKKILELADKMPHTKKKIPLQWHRVEKEICQPDWQHEKYLLLESFREKIVSR
ncbi:unnamed protein product [Porites evermanni]|uniref:Uncharacterized protein n=1 Tax=Porites evermanni TaxID=104178 RepID=A0ABN8M5I0_9CNID|nr:unnamed protein product [Porites evermanni]